MSSSLHVRHLSIDPHAIAVFISCFRDRVAVFCLKQLTYQLRFLGTSPTAEFSRNCRRCLRNHRQYVSPDADERCRHRALQSRKRGRWPTRAPTPTMRRRPCQRHHGSRQVKPRGPVSLGPPRGSERSPPQCKLRQTTNATSMVATWTSTRATLRPTRSCQSRQAASKSSQHADEQYSGGDDFDRSEYSRGILAGGGGYARWPFLSLGCQPSCWMLV